MYPFNSRRFRIFVYSHLYIDHQISVSVLGTNERGLQRILNGLVKYVYPAELHLNDTQQHDIFYLISYNCLALYFSYIFICIISLFLLKLEFKHYCAFLPYIIIIILNFGHLFRVCSTSFQNIGKYQIKYFYSVKEYFIHYKSLYDQLLIKDLMDLQMEKFAFMVDVSGSTGSSDNYWSTVGTLLAIHANQIEHYYEWDSSITKTSKKQMEDQIASKSGKGGTSPEVVAQQIKSKGYKKVILITDGQVSDHNVKQCDKILQGYKFTKTICYIIASSGYGVLNMSVTCPFTRRCENQVYQKYQDKPLKKLVQYTPEDYKILDTLDQITLQNFQANYDKIQGLIIALNMGKEGNIPLKNQLVQMKNRLLKELSKKMKGEFDINQNIRSHLEKGDLEGALKLAEKITNQYFSQSITLDLGKKINHLINLCGDLRGQYDLNQIKSNKMARAQDAKQGKIDQNAEAAQISKNLIECPIIMDQDVPQILVDECQPILVGIEKAIVDDITACPLRILNYPEIKSKLKARLSNYMGVKYADKFLKNPFTQRKLLGSIPLGSHKSHIKVGNYTIARMFSDGKILGNLNLFFAVIWYIIKQKEIEYLKDIEKNVTEHLIHRLKNSKTMASLCGLPQFVNTQIASDLAIWYCVNSGCLNLPPNRDTFRFHLYNMQPLIAITKAFGYPNQKGIQNHLNRVKSLIGVLAALKKSNESVRTSFRQGLKGLYQNSIQIDTRNLGKQFSKEEIVVNLVPIDGQAPKQKVEKIVSLLPKSLKQLPLEEILKIGSLLNTQKLASDYQIELNFKADNLPQFEINWVYELKQQNQLKAFQQKICPKTLRTYSNEQNKSWKQVSEKKGNARVKKLFKGRKYFEEFLKKYERIPTKDQLILFFYNRYVVAKKTRTLPYLTQIWAGQLIRQYSEILTKHKISVTEAVKLLAESHTAEKRKLLQKEAE